MPDSYAIDADWNALYVDGEWTAAESDETLAVEDPSTREQVATVPAAVEADVDAAYEAAAEAQPEWAAAPPARRAEAIQNAIEALQAHSDDVTDLLAHEAGGSQIMGETLDYDGVDDSLVVEPTVLSDVTNDMPAACNEHFGPIAPVIPFSDIDEAVAIANDTEYGLAGSVHAGDLGTGMDIADRMETG